MRAKVFFSNLTITAAILHFLNQEMFYIVKTIPNLLNGLKNICNKFLTLTESYQTACICLFFSIGFIAESTLFINNELEIFIQKQTRTHKKGKYTQTRSEQLQEYPHTHTSQHMQVKFLEYPSKLLKRKSLLTNFCIIDILFHVPVNFSACKIASHAEPSRRLISWTYPSMSLGGPMCLTSRISGKSIPIPNAAIAKTTHNVDSFVKPAIIAFPLLLDQYNS